MNKSTDKRPNEYKRSGTKMLIENSIFIAASRGIQIVSSYFVLIVIVRYLPVKQYGEYAFVIALVTSIMALTYFGIQQVMIREIAKGRDNAEHFVGVSIILRFCLSIIAALILIVLIQFMDLSSMIIAAIFIAIASEFFLTFSMLSKAVFQAYEKMKYEPLVTLIYSIVLATCVIIIIYLDMGFIWLFIALAFSNFVQVIAAVYIVSTRFVIPIFKVDKALFKIFLKDSCVIGLGIFFYLNLFRINILMLKWFGSPDDVAFFHAPHNLILQLQVLPFALITALFPVFSRLIHDDPAEMVNIYEKVFKHLFIFSIMFAMCFSLYAKEIIEIVFGSRYSQSVVILAILSWAIIPLSMDMFFNAVLIAMNKQKYAVIYGGSALAINILAAVVFVPMYGFLAATCLALFSYVFVFFFSLYYITRHGFPVVLDRIAVKTAVAGSLSAAAIMLLKPVSIFIAAPIGIIVYLGMLEKMKIMSLGELINRKKSDILEPEKLQV
jgi:O-antigen/teichoic acid export membrane protein